MPDGIACAFDYRAKLMSQFGSQAWRPACWEEKPQFEDCAVLLDPAQMESGVGQNLLERYGQGFRRPPLQQARIGQKLLGGGFPNFVEGLVRLWRRSHTALLYHAGQRG